MNKFALLCPGQGAQSAHMFALANQHGQAASFVQEALRQSIEQHTLADALSSPDLLFENRYAQPLIIAATLANWLALRDDIPTPDLIAGYSVGEIAAQAVSGSMDVQSALQVAIARAALMQACVHMPQSMLAVSGVVLADLQRFAASHDLHVAIINADNKAILAGLANKMTAAIPELASLPGHDIACKEVAVYIASHTPLMQAAAPGFAQLLDDIPVRAPDIPVLAGINGEKISQPVHIRSSLLAQMTQAIHWHACMDALAENGIRCVLELGPGLALSKMLQVRHPRIACRSVAEFRSLDGVRNWVQSQLER